MVVDGAAAGVVGGVGVVGVGVGGVGVGGAGGVGVVAGGGGAVVCAFSLRPVAAVKMAAAPTTPIRIEGR